MIFATVVVARADDFQRWTAERLSERSLEMSERELSDKLAAEPKADEVRAGLGICRFGRAVEKMAQTLYRHGLRVNSTFAGAVPFLRLPLPPNNAPQETKPDDLRAMLVQWIADMNSVEAALSKVENRELKLPVAFAKMYLQYAPGQPPLSLGEVYSRIATNGRASGGEEFVVAVDYADVLWFRAYARLTSFMAEVILAHDAKKLFEHTAHLAFPKAKSPYHEMFRQGWNDRGFESEIVDGIAFLHLLNVPVREPARMKAALENLEEAFRLSRKMWAAIQAETDDDREWIPNPRQKNGVIPGVRITDDMVAGWTLFLNEMESIVAGKKLIPFWRDRDRGINLRRMFTEPRDFDLILWIQGPGAEPFLEKGAQTDPATWNRLQQMFRGEFFGFAFYIN
jgi:hypothetical protein